MNSDKLLTIAIPTYNRAAFLMAGLNHVLSQLETEDCDVEILVSDNASTDETQNLMKKLCEKYSCIRYIRNKTNVGPDHNFLNCLREAKGKFVHLLSDDDVLVADSLRRVKECIIENPDLSMIYLNFGWFIGNYDCNNPYITKHFDFDNNQIYNNPEEFLHNVHIHITYISALVFNKERFNAISQPEQYIGTNLLQAHLVLKCIGSGKTAIISHVCISSLAGNSGGYDIYKIFTYQWKYVLYKTGRQAGFSKSFLRKIFKISLRKQLRPMVKQFRITNTKNNFGLQKRILFKNTWNYMEAWVYVYPYAFIPVNIFKCGKKAEIFVRKIKKLIKSKNKTSKRGV